MRSHGQAIFWEICRKNFAALVAFTAAPFVFLLLAWIVSLSVGTFPSSLLEHPKLFDYREEVSWGILLLLFVMLGCVAGSLVTLNYTESEYKSGENHFPSRTFHFPASTLKLTTYPLAVCVLGPAVLFVLWQGLVFLPLRIQFPILIPVLSLVAGGVWLQVFIWKYPALPAARLTAMVLGMLAVVGVNLPFLGQIKAAGETVRLLQDFAPPFTANQLSIYTSAAIPLLLLVGALGYWLAIRTVETERRGRNRGKVGTVDATHKELASQKALVKEGGFKSRLAAQGWSEMRRNGFAFPLATLGVMLLANLILPFVLKLDGEGSKIAFFSLLAVAPLLGAFTGIGFGRPDFWAKDGGLSPFISNWPISNAEIIRVKLRVALKTAAAACLFTLIGSAVVLLVTGDSSVIKKWLGQNEKPAIYLFLLEAAILYVAVTWRFVIGTLPWGLSGRPKLFLIMAVGGNLFGLVLLALGFGFFTSLYSGSLRRLDYFPYLVWAAGILIVVKIVSAVICFQKCDEKGLVSRKTMLKFVMLWVFLSALAIHFALSLPNTQAWARHAMAFVSVLAFPLGRLPMAHVLLHWNRHQRARSFGK